MANIAPSQYAQALQMATYAPDYQTQQAQVQRNYALAQKMREMSLEDSQAPGGRVSWTQGLARLAEALSANIANKRGDAQSLAMNRALAQNSAGAVGSYQGGGGQASGGPGAASAPPPPTLAVPDSPDAPPSGVPQAPSPTAPSQTAPQPGQPDPLAPTSQGPAAGGGSAQAPSQPGAGPGLLGNGSQHWVPGPMALSGTPSDVYARASDFDEYNKNVIGNLGKAGAPTDIEVMQRHRDQAAQAGDWATVQALSGAIDKANYIAPVNVREGGVALDGRTMQPVFQAGKSVAGTSVDYQNGRPSGMHALPGAGEALATVNAAEAGGKAAGGAPYEMVQVFNKDIGQMEYVPKSTMVGGASGAPGGGGTLGSFYGGQGGGHFAAGPPMGAQSASDQYGKFSGGAFGDIQSKAANSPQALQSLREMSQLANSGQASTGPAASKMQELGQKYGLNFLTKPGNFAFNKDAARYISQSAANVGLNGSDARLGMVASATPGQYMPLAALNQVLPVAQGLEMANMAQADAAGKWGQAHPNDIGGFQSFWRQNYDPRMFTTIAHGGPAALAHAPPQQRAHWLQQYRALKDAGVNFGAFQ